MPTKAEDERRSEHLEPAWSRPEAGKTREWLHGQLSAAGIAFAGLLVFGSVVALSALVENAFGMIVPGAIGVVGLRKHRRAGHPVMHTGWVVSFFLLLGGLLALPFCLF